MAQTKIVDLPDWVDGAMTRDINSVKLLTSCCCESCGFTDWKGAVCAAEDENFLCQRNMACECLNLSGIKEMYDENGLCSCTEVGGGILLCCGRSSSACECCSMPTTCVKAKGQTCCINQKIAIPCDDEVPCMIACCNVVLYDASKK